MRTGLDRLLERVPEELRGARVALLSHAGALSGDGAAAVDALAAHPGLHLVRLLAAEHGLRGERPAGEAVADGRDGPSGLPVVSLYGGAGAGAALRGCDALLVDLQDIGCRYFTFPGSVRRLLGPAAAAGCPVWVLDRPNPLGGETAGPVAVPVAARSLVAAFSVPVRHGLTLGELALLAAREDGLPPGAVRVLSVEDWRRADGFPAWGRPWIPPSPNSSGPEMAELYPGTALVEGTNLSEGRGTPYPFRQLGAPWVDGPLWARRAAPLLPVGLRVRPVWFVPTASKHAGAPCQGVALDLVPGVARAADAALVSAVHLLSLAVEAGWVAFVAHGGGHWLDRLSGGPALREALGRPAAVEELLAGWRAEAAAFARNRPVDLYPA